MYFIKEHMRVGIIHSMAFPSSFEEEELVHSFKMIAKDSFFDVIEIGEIKDVRIREVVKKIVEESKLTLVCSGHSRLLANGFNINDLNEEGRKKSVEALKKGIDEAYEMGAESFTFLSRTYDADKIEEALEALLKSTRELCSYSKQKGNMNIILEVFDNDVDKKSLLGPVGLVKRFAEEMKAYPNFGVMVDLSHLPLLREGAEESIIPIKEYIKHVHIGNAVAKDASLEAYGDEHPRFGFPNSANGEEELIKFLKVLKEVGYFNKSKRPILSFEVKPRSYEDSEIIIANTKRIFKRAWSMVI